MSNTRFLDTGYVIAPPPNEAAALAITILFLIFTVGSRIQMLLEIHRIDRSLKVIFRLLWIDSILILSWLTILDCKN